MSGGSHIISPRDEVSLWQEYVARDDAEKIIAYAIKNNYDFSLEDTKNVYTPGGIITAEHGPHIDFLPIEKADVSKLVKIVIIPKLSMEKTKAIEKYMQDNFSHIFLTKAKSPFDETYGIDVTSNNASKYVAAVQVQKILHINSQDTVAVGDGHNDMGLLKACGIKVAMGNAPEELKAIADFVAPSVNEDGLVTVIKKYFLET